MAYGNNRQKSASVRFDRSPSSPVTTRSRSVSVGDAGDTRRKLFDDTEPFANPKIIVQVQDSAPAITEEAKAEQILVEQRARASKAAGEAAKVAAQPQYDGLHTKAAADFLDDTIAEALVQQAQRSEQSVRISRAAGEAAQAAMKRDTLRQQAASVAIQKVARGHAGRHVAKAAEAQVAEKLAAEAAIVRGARAINSRLIAELVETVKANPYSDVLDSAISARAGSFDPLEQTMLFKAGVVNKSVVESIVMDKLKAQSPQASRLLKLYKSSKDDHNATLEAIVEKIAGGLNDGQTAVAQLKNHCADAPLNSEHVKIMRNEAATPAEALAVRVMQKLQKTQGKEAIYIVVSGHHNAECRQKSEMRAAEARASEAKAQGRPVPQQRAGVRSVVAVSQAARDAAEPAPSFREAIHTAYQSFRDKMASRGLFGLFHRYRLKANDDVQATLKHAICHGGGNTERAVMACFSPDNKEKAQELIDHAKKFKRYNDIVDRQIKRLEKLYNKQEGIVAGQASALTF
jgi:hypothetical protein